MQEIELGGRRFRVIDFDRRTVVQDHYLMKVMRATGADKVMPMDGEGNAEYLVRLQTCLIDSGRAPDLIAGFLLPLGKEETDFTLAMAAETAKHISGCNTPEDREAVITLSVDAVFGFFQQGLDWLKRFRDSSENVMSEPPSPGTNQALH